MSIHLAFHSLEWENNSQPKYLQLYGQIRHAILNGQLKSGEQLPSGRALAR